MGMIFFVVSGDLTRHVGIWTKQIYSSGEIQNFLGLTPV